MSKSDISIIRANVDDAPILAKFVGKLLVELTGDADLELNGLLPVAQNLLADGAITAFIAKEKDQVVGVIVLNTCAAIYAGGYFGEITELYINPEHRSLGVAALLIQEAQKFGKQQNWKRLEVGAPQQPEWARTVQFYLREGFEEVGPRLRKIL